MRLTLPVDALLVLIGAAGCGKSTFAREHFLPTEIVSSDACRAMVSDDEESGAASRDAFELMHFVIDKRLKRGHLTVADATNVRIDKRADLLAIASRHKRPAVAVVLDLPEDECRRYNRERPHRQVPAAAIRAHRALLARSLPGLEAEGFSAVHVLKGTGEVEQVEVARTPPKASRARRR